MKLILTRHGETEENKKGIIQGHLPGTLSAEGIEQAEKLAERLKDESIDCIFSSDLKRAADTAKIVAKYHPGVEIFYTQELREGNPGAFTGQKSKEVNWNNRPNDAETREQMRERIVAFLDRIHENNRDKSVVFVGHNGINKTLIAYLMGYAADEMDQVGEQQNTAINIIEINDDKSHKICLSNCAKHLD